ncbi:MAG: aspartate kinase [Eubacteriales bacterium]|nr:aspartate kinase [Eubacteriales bacterium]
MALIVQKYGGSSVANAVCIKRVAENISKYHNEGNQVVVVVSAMGDSTDDLITLAKQLNEKPSPREMDMLLATGEQVSIALLSIALDSAGKSAVSLTGPQVGILTTNVHSKARIKKVKTQRIQKELDQNKIVIVAGFQGKTEEDEITTLGRGGSDTTAVALAAALKADMCEIYTDVTGVFTADPRVVNDAQKLDHISYDEMLELASLGARVLHVRSVELAKLYNVPMCVRSSYVNEEGTIVVSKDSLEKDVVVTGVAHDLNVAKISIFDVPDQPGIASTIFTKLAKENINVDMIVQSSMRDKINDISMTVPEEEMDKAVRTIKSVSKEFDDATIEADNDVAKVSIVGAGMISSPGVAAKMFHVLAENKINIDMISTSEIKVSCIVKRANAIKALQVLHDAFDLVNINNK